MTDARPRALSPRPIPGATQGYRDLWAAVLAQALEDIDNAPCESIIFREAVSFFTDGGEWRRSRIDIADHLDLAADDLERAGRHRINARRQAAGQAPLAARAAATPAAKPGPLPRLEAKPRFPFKAPPKPAARNPFTDPWPYPPRPEAPPEKQPRAYTKRPRFNRENNPFAYRLPYVKRR